MRRIAGVSSRQTRGCATGLSSLLRLCNGKAALAGINVAVSRRNPAITPQRHFSRCAILYSASSEFGEQPSAGNGSAASGVSPDEILEVELLECDTGTFATDGADAAFFSDDHASVGSSSSGSSRGFETVTALDAFAKAKVANYSKRAGGARGEAEVREVQSAAPGETVFHVRQHLPLPPGYPADCYAEGFAATRRDAETAAAMHAERILDALGVPVFQLSSKQNRHASAAREAGRWAPLAGEPMRSPDTPLPPPVQFVPEGAVRQMERKLHIDHLSFARVRRGAVAPMRHSLASPFFLDTGSAKRVRGFFVAHRSNMKNNITVTALHHRAGDAATGRRARQEVAKTDEEAPSFLARLRLPVAPEFGPRVCMGRAATRADALTLAFMHAELTIDALGLELYPGDAARQIAHADECKQLGRYATPPGAAAFRYDSPTPPPLQLEETPEARGEADRSDAGSAAPSAAGDTQGRTTLSPAGSVATAELRGAAQSVESLLLSHTRAVAKVSRTLEVPVLEPLAISLLRFLTGDTAEGGDAGNFLVQALGVEAHLTFRATKTIRIAQPANSSVTPEEFVCVGVAATELDAKLASATHALLVMLWCAADEWRALLPAPSSSDAVGDGALPGMAAALKRLRDLLPSAGSAGDTFREGLVRMAVRHVSSEHLGRVSMPNLNAERRRAGRARATDGRLSRAAVYMDMEDSVLAALRAERRRRPHHEWDLAPDGDGRIFVPPVAEARDGPSYAHTLGAVRSPDVFAPQRLRDYLERHGKDTHTALTVAAVGASGGDTHGDTAPAPLFAAQVVLPLPLTSLHGAAVADLAPVVARGESDTAADASLLCAVHAELVLDALGHPLYDDAVLQRRHADTARMLGRWASLSGSTRPPPEFCPAAPPPPLRRLESNSAEWSTMQRRTAQDTAAASATPAAEVTSETPLTASSPSSSAAPTDLTDDQLCHESRLQAVHSSGIMRNPFRHACFFYDSRGSNFWRVIRRYTVRERGADAASASGTKRTGGDTAEAKASPTGRVVHRAIAEIPVSPVYGKRYAVGCASDKRTALALCAMHALYTLNALGIQIYSGNQQRDYVRMMQARGQWAASPGEPIRPGSTPSPKGLCCFQNTLAPLPEPPEPPSAAAVQASPEAWAQYTQQCRRYIMQAAEVRVIESLFVECRAPRSGVDVEDDTLEAVERLPKADYGLKASLMSRCRRYGFPPPASKHFPCKSHVSPTAGKCFLTEVPVMGTPYTARGYGKSSKDSIARAAMHYDHILFTISNKSGMHAAQPPLVLEDDGPGDADGEGS